MRDTPQVSPDPVEPGGPPLQGPATPDEMEIQRTLHSIHSTPPGFRVAAGLILIAFGLVALVLGTSLIHSKTPGTAPVVLLFIEPGGFFLLCIGVLVLAPQSRAISWFRASYYHLRAAFVLIAIVGGVGAILLIGYLLVALFRQ